MLEKKEIPASRTTDGDSIEKLFKINDSNSLSGLSDGVQAAYVHSPEQWLADAEQVAYALARAGEVFTVDDLRRAGLSEPDKPQRWGSLIAVLRNRGDIQLAGFELHRVNGGDLVPLRQWQGTTRALIGEVGS